VAFINPSISVVICIYNGERTLESAVNSILKIDYDKSDYEIILIDDGSSDKSSKICERFIHERKKLLPKIIYAYQDNKGLAGARNSGILLSSGEIIAFIDQDAVAKFDWLTELMKPFFHNEADFVGGRVELLNQNSKVAFFSQITRHIQRFGTIDNYNTFVGCNMAFKKSIFIETGGFYKNFTRFGDETSLFERIKVNYQYVSASDAIVYHERPEKLNEFLASEWDSNLKWGLISKASGSQGGLKPLLIIFEGILIILIPFIFLVSNEKTFYFLLFISLLAFIRRAFIRPISRKIFINLKINYGTIMGLALHILYWYCSTFLTTIGKILGYFKYYKIDLMPENIDSLPSLDKYKSNE